MTASIHSERLDLIPMTLAFLRASLASAWTAPPTYAPARSLFPKRRLVPILRATPSRHEIMCLENEATFVNYQFDSRLRWRQCGSGPRQAGHASRAVSGVAQGIPSCGAG